MICLMTDSVSRRHFVRAAAGAAALAQAARGANERARIGFIGVGARGFGGHVKRTALLKEFGAAIDLAAVCDIYSVHRERAVNYIAEQTGVAPQGYHDYRDLLGDDSIDAVFIGTPDHWHAKMTIAALAAGKHVYCEKPMTKTIDEAFAVVDAWKASGKVMSVGVQSTSLPVWNKANALIRAGKLGKVVQFQTEYYRNTNHGQWRNRRITMEMTPQTIDWDRWLGKEEGLAPDMPFDRAVYVQWRAYWPFGAGLYTDLFVHRTTTMLKATGLGLPGRVTGAGGIFLEYDGRDVPDVATVVADYNEGAQLIVSASMVSAGAPLKQVIRGHLGSFVFGDGARFTGFDFVPESERAIGRVLPPERIEADAIEDDARSHMRNFVDAVLAEDPDAVNNPPDLGANAVVTINLGARSYREGKVFFVDPATRRISTDDPGWSKKWESMSRNRSKPNHLPGWEAGDTGSLIVPPEQMKIAGPWVDGKDPAAR